MSRTLLNREGYFRTAASPQLPMPMARRPWKGQRDLLASLIMIENREAQVVSFSHLDSCRFCDAKFGYRVYRYGNWQWPEGLRHYIEAHNLRPSLAFQEYILGHYVCETVRTGT
jgi:hypothetical protein